MLSLLSSRGSKAQRAAARASPLVQPHKDKYTDLSIKYKDHFAFTRLVNLLGYMTMVLAPTKVREVRGALRAAFLIFYSR